MKKIILTFILLWSFNFLTAQDKIYVHTATAANTGGYITYIDHPDLNGHPNAGIVFCHAWNPNGKVSSYNNNVDALWYDSGVGKWAIYNEDHTTPMVLGAHFFVYIASNPANVITHVATGTPSYTTTIDDPDFNGNNPGPYAILSHYFNPSGIYNTNLEGFYYESGHRKIYNEDGSTPIPTGAAYKILKNGTGVVTHLTHVSSASNILGATTVIDNPDLNNNPDATFVFSHYWGVFGSHQTDVNLKVSAFYFTSLNKWGLLTEDQTAFPVDAAFDIIITNQDPISLAVNDISNVENITLFPNPVSTSAKITANQPITHISIFNLLGQKVREYTYNNAEKQIEITISELSNNTYIVKVATQTGAVQVLKMVKK